VIKSIDAFSVLDEYLVSNYIDSGVYVYYIHTHPFFLNDCKNRTE
jgi:hypothetical protein